MLDYIRALLDRLGWHRWLMSGGDLYMDKTIWRYHCDICGKTKIEVELYPNPDDWSDYDER